MKDAIWRFKFSRDGFDTTRIVQYKKGPEDENIPGQNNTRRKTIPGIKFTSGNKKTACALLKMELEKFNIEIYDLVTVGEIENFEDKNGSGTYKASYGHDDIVMTLCQIPMLKNTPKYKDFVEEFEINNIKTNLPDAQAKSQEWDGNIFGMNEILSVSDSFNNQEGSLYDLGYDYGMSGDLYSF